MSDDQIIDEVIKFLSQPGKVNVVLDQFILKELEVNDKYRPRIIADKLDSNDLTQYSSSKFIVHLSTFGRDIADSGGWLKYLEQSKIEASTIKKKEDLNFKKSKVDLELAEKMLKEYPKTKWIARISFIIGIGLGLLELARATGLLKSP